MKLSIIVPVYNMASDQRLSWCLESLVRQKTLQGQPLDDYEIIAVDDCSEDESWKILQDYAARYPGRVLALRGDRNRHQGGAKNQGLAHASGEWIAFIDADDWVIDRYCAALLSKAEETGADCVGTDYCIVHEHTMEAGPVVANSRAEQTGLVDDARRRSMLVDFGSLCVKIYRREIVLGETSGNDPAVAEKDAGTAAEEDYDAGGPQSDAGDCGAEGLQAAEGDSVAEGLQSDAGDFAAERTQAAAGERSGADSTRLSVFPEDIFYEDNAVVKTWVMRIRHYEYVPGPLYYYYQHEDSTVHTISFRRLEDRKSSGRLMIEEARRQGYLERYRPEIEYSFTVLFYKNTLFGALQSVKEKGVYQFVTTLGAEMRQTFPAFQDNTYYQARTDAEEQKLIAMQMRSPLRFYLYYRLLWLYRRIRYGRG